MTEELGGKTEEEAEEDEDISLFPSVQHHQRMVCNPQKDAEGGGK